LRLGLGALDRLSTALTFQSSLLFLSPIYLSFPHIMPNAPKTKARALEFVPGSTPSELALAGSTRFTEPTPFGATQSAESAPLRAPGSSATAGPSHLWQSDPSQSSQLRGSTPTVSSHPTGSGSGSSAQLAQGQDNTEEEEPLGEDDRRAFLAKLESFTSQYRDRQITKMSALAGIISIVVKLSLSEPEKDQTIKLYIEELESIRHGGEPDPPRVDGGRSFIEPTQRVDRASIAVDSANGSQPADSDDDLDGPRKKRKLTAADFPWYEADNRSLLALPASCIQTCKRLEVYLQDIPGCRNQIKVAPGAPRNVPITQWE